MDDPITHYWVHMLNKPLLIPKDRKFNIVLTFDRDVDVCERLNDDDEAKFPKDNSRPYLNTYGSHYDTFGTTKTDG